MIPHSQPYRLAVLALIGAGHVMLFASLVPNTFYFYHGYHPTISEVLYSLAALPLIIFYGAFIVELDGHQDLSSVVLLCGGWLCLSAAGFMMGNFTRWLPYWIERVGLSFVALVVLNGAELLPGLPVSVIPLLFLLPVLYVLTRDALFGGSPVRQLLGTRVVTHRGPVKLWQSIVRNLPLCVPVLPWICLWQLFVGKPTRLGERMSRTWVVRKVTDRYRHQVRSAAPAPCALEPRVDH